MSPKKIVTTEAAKTFAILKLMDSVNAANKQMNKLNKEQERLMKTMASILAEAIRINEDLTIKKPIENLTGEENK